MLTKYFKDKKIEIRELKPQDLKKAFIAIPKQLQYKGKLVDEVVMIKEI